MSFVEFLGFIITFAAMTAIMVKKSREERDRRKHPEKYENEEQEREQDLKKLLKTLNIDLEDEEEFSPPRRRQVKPLPPPPQNSARKQPKPKSKPQRIVGDEYAYRDKFDNYHLTTSIEKREFKSSVEEREKAQKFADDKIVSPEFLRRESDAYTLKKLGDKRCKGARLIGSLHTKKDMMVIHEILSKPVALR